MGVFRSKAPSTGLWIRRAGSLWHKRAGVTTLWSSRPMRVLDISLNGNVEKSSHISLRCDDKFIFRKLAVSFDAAPTTRAGKISRLRDGQKYQHFPCYNSTILPPLPTSTTIRPTTAKSPPDLLSWYPPAWVEGCTTLQLIITINDILKTI